jgi:hypothetical protein
MLVFFNDCKEVTVGQRLNKLLRERYGTIEMFFIQKSTTIFWKLVEKWFMYTNLMTMDENGEKPIK